MKILKTKKPKGPFLTKGDLNHDWAIELGCPAFHDDKLKFVSVKFTTEQAKRYQERFDGQLVVDPGLIRMLTDQYFMQIELSGNKPKFVSHMDYSFKRFLVVVNQSYRKMGKMRIPGPVRFLTFFAVRKRIVLNA